MQVPSPEVLDRCIDVDELQAASLQNKPKKEQ